MQIGCQWPSAHWTMHFGQGMCAALQQLTHSSDWPWIAALHFLQRNGSLIPNRLSAAAQRFQQLGAHGRVIQFVAIVQDLRLIVV